MPRQTGNGDALLLHGEPQSDMVQEDGRPGDKNSSSSQVDEPPKDSHGSIRETHEAEEHESGKEEHTHVGSAPRSRSEKDLRCLTLEGKTIQDTSTGEKTLIRR